MEILDIRRRLTTSELSSTHAVIRQDSKKVYVTDRNDYLIATIDSNLSVTIVNANTKTHKKYISIVNDVVGKLNEEERKMNESIMYAEGDVIVLNEQAHEELNGERATIKDIFKFNDKIVYAMELENMHWLHDCEGRVKPGYGWFAFEGQFESGVKLPVIRMIKKDDELVEDIKHGEIEYELKENPRFKTVYLYGEKQLIVEKSTDKIIKLFNIKDKKVLLHLLEVKGLARYQTITSDMKVVQFSKEELEEYAKQFMPIEESDAIEPQVKDKVEKENTEIKEGKQKETNKPKIVEIKTDTPLYIESEDELI